MTQEIRSAAIPTVIYCYSFWVFASLRVAIRQIIAKLILKLYYISLYTFYILLLV
jgi:hypothetical protein